jgi:hypothetical protein
VRGGRDSSAELYLLRTAAKRDFRETTAFARILARFLSFEQGAARAAALLKTCKKNQAV